jgi:WD40 repeat protein
MPSLNRIARCRAAILFAAVVCLLAAELRGAEPPVTALTIFPDGGSVVVGSQAGLRVLSWPDLSLVRQIDAGMPHIHDLAFAPDGTRLAACGGTPGESGVVAVLSWPDAALDWSAVLHTDLVYGLDWRPDGARLATGSLDQTGRIVDAASGAVLHTLEGHSRGVTDVHFLEAGRTVVTASVDQSLRVWDADSGAPQRTLNNHTAPVGAMAVRPLTVETALPVAASVGDDRTVRFWQPTIGRLMRFAKLPSIPLDCAWTPDGAALVVTCRDGHLRRIDPDTVEVLEDRPVLDGWAYSLAVHPGGQHAVVGGQGGELRVVPIAAR